MDSESDEDLLTHRHVARELLEASALKQLHGDWEVASKLRRYSLALLYDSIPRHSIPQVQFNIDDFTEDTCLFVYRFTHRQLRKLQVLFRLPDVIRTGGHSRACCSGLEGLCIVLHRLANRVGGCSCRGPTGGGRVLWAAFSTLLLI
ncbi:hypothetical protein PC123_g25935 [Phytophthora cactorum]|nr:hypothetical protein PC123_g25935 [Phytophthora cactorum]